MKKPSKKFNKDRLRSAVPSVPKRFKRAKSEERIQQAFENIPNITNETVAEHREDVLKGARKYKYPLEHSKHRIVIVSTVLLAFALVGFFVYIGLSLYKFQSTSAFTYRVSQVLPFPVGRAGSHFVAYENYLFEIRRYEHYYQSQQRVDFDTKSGRDQLATYKPRAMAQVVQNAYVKQLAAKNHVTVTGAELTAELDALRAQNQTGDQELAEVANKFFGWSIDDLKREISQELLAQKVAATLDKGAHTRADAARQLLLAGGNFTDIAKQHSESADKANGGEYGNQSISDASTDVPPAVVRELHKMKVGEVSNVIPAGNSLEIVKLLESKDGKYKAAHISFALKPIDAYVTDYKKTHPQHVYIKVD